MDGDVTRNTCPLKVKEGPAQVVEMKVATTMYFSIANRLVAARALNHDEGHPDACANPHSSSTKEG
eukprot:74532-Pleurochrysis_carterae.AAC.1